MKGRLKISKAFVQGELKVQFQRIEERLKIEARIYINLKMAWDRNIHIPT